MRLGIIARADKTGLGNQTRNLVNMLNPSRVMVIDSRPFNGNEQYLETYDKYQTMIVKGFPTNQQVITFLRGLDAVLTCELFYNMNFVTYANRLGIKTYNQYNYEFLDNLIMPSLPLPTKLLSPSKWKLEEMQQRFSNVLYLPPPIDHKLFEKVREHSPPKNGKIRLLHVVGRQAVHDRNGTLDLLQALAYTKEDFELVLRVQTSSPVIESYRADPRVTIDYDSPNDETQLYQGFHAMVLPRKYAGLCLPMNEALMSGLPVIMTDISPNNEILPDKWLVESQEAGSFKARTQITYYSADHKALAKKLDWLCRANLKKEKREAFDIGYKNYSSDVLLPKYTEVLQL